MESVAVTTVDPQALLAAAQRLDEAADLLHGALTGYLSALHFDADPGVRAAMDRLVADVASWQRAARETAAVLRTGAQRYSDAETQAAEALR